MNAYPVYGTGQKAKDPFFGLTMGGSSQASTDVFRYSSKNSFLKLLPHPMKIATTTLWDVYKSYNIFVTENFQCNSAIRPLWLLKGMRCL